MAEYVGFKVGELHEMHQVSEYYCGGCGYPLTDHDSFCPECGGALRQCDADRYTFVRKILEESANVYQAYKDFDEFQQKLRKTNNVSKLQKELHEKRNDLGYALHFCVKACNDLAENCGISL